MSEKKLYMVTYRKQRLVKEIGTENVEWVDDTKSNHTFYIRAENEEEAIDIAKISLSKVNEHASSNEQYVLNFDAKELIAVSVTHDANNGTSVTGIWK